MHFPSDGTLPLHPVFLFLKFFGCYLRVFLFFSSRAYLLWLHILFLLLLCGLLGLKKKPSDVREGARALEWLAIQLHHCNVRTT